MTAWTVLLSYPDYKCDGPSTYQAHVFARSPKEAALKARRTCKKVNDWTDDDVEDLDMLVLAVYKRHLIDYGGDFS